MSTSNTPQLRRNTSNATLSMINQDAVNHSGMKWNNKLLKWEGNDNEADVFEDMEKEESGKEEHKQVAHNIKVHLKVNSKLSDQEAYFSKLPVQKVVYILSYLPPLDLCRSAQVCKLWKELGRDNNALWKSLVFSTFSGSVWKTFLDTEILKVQSSTSSWLEVFKKMSHTKKELQYITVS